MKLTINSYREKIQNGELQAADVIAHYIKKSSAAHKKYNAYISINKDCGKTLVDTKTILAGAPIAVKDIMHIKGEKTSCASRMMENYIAPYTATCIDKLTQAGGVILGKTNMDEFAMGTTTESSFFGPVKNSYGTDRIPGGSSGGSAVAVAADLCIAALGTDTGGSVRQPASMCGVVGCKPTYGRVSRYGVQAMAPSLNQVGVITKTIADAKTLLSVISGYDPNDAMSNKKADQKDRETPDIFVGKKRKIALPRQYIGEGLDPAIRAQLLQLVEKLRGLGRQIDEVDMPILQYGVPIYYVLCPAEVSTDMSRFDGIRFGYQDDTMKYDDLQAYYDHVRSTGFGPEVQRRILLGTYVLSSAQYEGFYRKAQHARQKLIADFQKTFSQYDLIMSPVSPEVARKIGEKSDDPLKLYMADLYTLPANLAGIPAISIPMGMVENQGEMLPAGVQLMAPAWKESLMFAASEIIEKIT